MQIVNPRYELTNARLLRGWTEADIAERLHPHPTAETVRRWESGTQTPRADMIGELCLVFGVRHPKELNLDAQFNANASTHCREDELLAMLAKYDRRQLLELLNRLPILAGVDLTVLFSTTVVAPEKLLSVCRSVVKQCWNLLDENGSAIADVLLSECLPELESLATHLSPHRHEATLLAVEATIIQMIIATHKLDLSHLVSLGENAVRIAQISRDANIHAMALGWHGITYTKDSHCQPETAIATFNDALKCGDEISSLNKADIYMGMARAHALNGNEKLARDACEAAQVTMPDNPKLDSLYRFIRTGQSELDQREGRVYLVLMEKFPTEKEYAQKAHAAFKKSTSGLSMSLGYQGLQLIDRADAARVIDDMHDYLDSLEKGVPIARQIGSDEQIAKAVTVLQKAPGKWRNEQRYKELRKILTPKRNKQ